MSNYNKIAKFYDYFQFYCDWMHKNSIYFLRNLIRNDYKILDVACGTGNFLNRLQRKNKTLELFGIDESSKIIECARKKSTDIKFVVGQAEKLPFNDNTFDLITITGSFYCFKNKEDVLSECYRVLKDKGYLFVLTLAFDNFFQRLQMNACLASTKMTLFNVDDGAKYISLNDLENLAEKHNLYLIKTNLKRYLAFGNRFVAFKKTA